MPATDSKTFFRVTGRIVSLGESGFMVDSGTKPKTYYRPWELDWKFLDPMTEWMYLNEGDQPYEFYIGLWVVFFTNLEEQRDALPGDYGQEGER